MAVPTLVYDTLNINDGSTYNLMPGANIGAKKRTWDEYRGLGGSVGIANDSNAYLMEMTFPLRIQGTSLADLVTKIAAVSAKAAASTLAAPKTLTFNGTAYSIVAGREIEWSVGQREANAFYTVADLKVWRAA